MEKPLKLQAVTVCINYSDYLQCVLENRIHFDRWIILTVPEDSATVALCQAAGIEYLLSSTLASNGADFHATQNKSSILNEGLERLDPQGWALILDADVRLPRNFRERLDALPLESGALYGTSGRKVCIDRKMFDMIVHLEPWDRFCEHYPGIIGFFQLFDLEHPRNRYLPSNWPNKGPGDDDQFQVLFPPELRRRLPLTVIHVGPVCANWSGRIAAPFAASTHKTPCERVFPLGGFDRAAFVGFYPGMPRMDWLTLFSHAYTLDQFGLNQRSTVGLVESDREVLRRLWREATRGLRMVLQPMAHTASSIESIPNGSLDLVYLSGEVTPDWLAIAWPIWATKLRDDAIVAGDLFGFPYWPDSTYAVSLLIGSPDFVGKDGFWWKKMRDSERPQWLRSKSPESMASVPEPITYQDGVVLVLDTNKGNLQEFLLSLESLRNYWSGSATVYHWGESNHLLTIVCALLGINLKVVGKGLITDGNEDEAMVKEAIHFTPYLHSLFIPGGTLVTQSLSQAFVAPFGEECSSFLEPQLWVVEGMVSRRLTVPYSEATDSSQSANSFLCFSGLPETWSEASWEERCAKESELSARLARKALLPESCLVVTIVTCATLPEFERSWPSWEFSGGTEVVVILEDCELSGVWFAGPRRPTFVWSFLSDHRADVLRWFQEKDGPRSIALIAARAVPLPGATWPDYTLDVASDGVICSQVSSSSPPYVHLHTAGALHGLFSAAYFRAAISEVGLSTRGSTTFSEEMFQVLSKGNVLSFDARSYGWVFS